MNKPRKVTTTIMIRFRDIDAMGHVNNSLYFTYFEEARKEFLYEVFSIANPSDYPFILAKTSCDYMKPIKLTDQVSVSIWISKTSTKSFTFSYEIFDVNDPSIVYGKGESIMVVFDYVENKTLQLSDDFLNRIADYRE